MDQSIRLPEVEALTKAVQELTEQVVELRQKVVPAKMWYSRAELAALKGIPVSAFYNKPWLLPGKPHKQAGVDRWSWRQVWDSGWIWQSDKDLNPKEGKGDGTRSEAGSQPPGEAEHSELRGMRRQRPSAVSGQSG